MPLHLQHDQKQHSQPSQPQPREGDSVGLTHQASSPVVDPGVELTVDTNLHHKPNHNNNNNNQVSSPLTSQNHPPNSSTSSPLSPQATPPARQVPLLTHRTQPLYEAPPGFSKEQILKEHAAYLSNSLNKNGYSVIDGLLGMNKANLILGEMMDLCDSDVMVPGQLDKDHNQNSNAHGHNDENFQRGDKITWLSGQEPKCKNIKQFMNVVDHMITFCRGSFPNKIGGRTQAMAACYAGDGVGFKTHIDNPSQDGRCITCLYYVNKDWDSARDGGCLRLHPNQDPSYVILEPVADRLVMFWSNERTPHEVMPPYRKRFALTLWYFDEEEREAERRRTSGQFNSLPPNNTNFDRGGT